MSTVPATSAADSSNNTVQSFVTSLVTNISLLAIEVFAFTYLRRKYTRIYSPRSFLPPPSKRSPDLPSSILGWIPAAIRMPAKEIIHKNGLDAYMFVRFLKLLIMIFVPVALLTFAVILPVDAVGNGGSGLSRFSSGNIPTNKQKRYAAHLIVAYILTFYVIWLLRRELLRFVKLRHQFLLSKSHSKLAQAKTVLITSLPEHDLNTEADLRTFASFVPGGVAKVWIYRDAPGLNDAYSQRMDACQKLEGAISGLLRDAVKAQRKKDKKDGTTSHAPSKRNSAMLANGNGKTNGHGELTAPIPPRRPSDLESAASSSPLAMLHQMDRPTHNLNIWGIPWTGRKVDTIEWCKEQIPKLTKEIEDARKELPNAKPHGAAMIMCNLQMGAHVLAQCTSYHEPLRMVDKWIELAPDDVVWDNIDDGAIETRGRWILSWIATIGLIILWSFPVAFTGSLSNIDQLCNKVSWLHWICTMPDPLPGIVQGVLPPLFLAILFLLLPLVLKGLAYFECIPRWSLISISVYRRYYLLLVIQGFLVVTLSSGLTSAIPEIANSPIDLVQGLAQRLPNASIFYLTYLISNGFAAAGTALLQLLPLVLHAIKRWLFGNTPRQAYNVEFIMPKTNLGTTLPRISLLATIGLAYAVIAPIVAAFASIAFTLLWFAWKFLMTWVMDQPEAQETGGLYFPLAVSNLFVGLYTQHLSLAALFFLATDEQKRRSSIPEAVLMLVLAAITLLAQYTLSNSFRPITNYLPMSLATKEMVKRYNRRREAAAAKEAQLPFGGILPPQIGPLNLGGGAETLQAVQAAGQGALHQVDEALDLFSAQNVKSIVRRRFRRKKSAGRPLPEDEEESEALAQDTTGASPTMVEGGDDHELKNSMSVDGPPPPPPPGMEPIPRDRASMVEHGYENNTLVGDPRANEKEPAPEQLKEKDYGADEKQPVTEADRPPARPRTSSNATSNFTDVSRHSSERNHANPGSPGAPAAAAGLSTYPPKQNKLAKARPITGLYDEPDSDEEDAEEEVDEHAFDHPSTYKAAPWIWIPRDEYGFAEAIMDELKAAGVEASMDGARILNTGRVKVTRNPPDQEWIGGNDI